MHKRILLCTQVIVENYVVTTSWLRRSLYCAVIPVNRYSLWVPNVSRAQSGFTLLEVLTVFTIGALLLAIGAPAMGTFIQNNALQGQSFKLLSSIKFARSEAIKRRTRVVVCRSADPTADSPSCGGTNRVWTTGWLVFAAGDTNSTYEPASDTLLRVGNPAVAQVNIRSNSQSDPTLEYNADGTTNEGGGTARFTVCDSRGDDFGRRLQIPPHGRPKLELGATTTIDCDSP